MIYHISDVKVGDVITVYTPAGGNHPEHPDVAFALLGNVVKRSRRNLACALIKPQVPFLLDYVTVLKLRREEKIEWGLPSSQAGYLTRIIKDSGLELVCIFDTDSIVIHDRS